MGHDGELDICGKFIKCCMFVANVIMFIGGVVIVILGVWTIQEKGFINALVGTNLFLGSVYILIFCGVALCGVSFSGCLASVREMKCLLLTYALAVFILLVMILIGGILAYTFRDKVHSSMEQEMYSSIKTYGEEKALSRAWDDIQEVLECCGVMSYTDWKGHIPESCCRLSSGKRVNCKVFQTSLNIWKNGCLNVTEEFIRAHAAIVAGAAVSVSSLMLLGFIFGLVMFKMIE